MGAAEEHRYCDAARRLLKIQGDLHITIRSYEMSVKKAKCGLKTALEKSEGKKLTTFSDFTKLGAKARDLTIEEYESMLGFFGESDIQGLFEYPVFQGGEWVPEGMYEVLDACSLVLSALLYHTRGKTEDYRVDRALQRVLLEAGFFMGALWSSGAEKSDRKQEIGRILKKGYVSHDEIRHVARTINETLSDRSRAGFVKRKLEELESKKEVPRKVYSIGRIRQIIEEIK